MRHRKQRKIWKLERLAAISYRGGKYGFDSRPVEVRDTGALDALAGAIAGAGKQNLFSLNSSWKDHTKSTNDWVKGIQLPRSEPAKASPEPMTVQHRMGVSAPSDPVV